MRKVVCAVTGELASSSPASNPIRGSLFMLGTPTSERTMRTKSRPGFRRLGTGAAARRKARLGSDGWLHRGNNVAPAMASRGVPIRCHHQGGSLRCATLVGICTARMQMTTARRLDRTGWVSRQELARASAVGVKARNRRKQGLGVGMTRGGEDLFAGSALDDAPEIHHRHARSDVLHHR